MCFMHSLSESQKCPILIPCKTATWRVGLISGKNDKIEVVHFQPYPASLCPFPTHRDAVKQCFRARLWNWVVCLFLIFLTYSFIFVCAESPLVCRLSVAGLRLSLVVVSRGCSLVVVCGLPIAVASLVAEHRLWAVWTSVVTAHRLSCPLACRISLDQGSNQTYDPCISRQIPDHRASPKLSKLEF